jgi:hypothetical protein
VRTLRDYGSVPCLRLTTFEQLLRTTSTAEIDTRTPADQVVDALERIVNTLSGRVDHSVRSIALR